jgi:DNA-binding response OmpR family regulator
MAKILLVEDDEAAATMASEYLTDERYTVEIASDGKEALQLMNIYTYDVILLDWDLPGLPGYEVCRQYRQTGGSTPIILVTGKSASADKIAGLDAGADDYLTKPFSLPELSARIRARLRTASATTTNILSINDISLDTVNYMVKKNGTEISLLPKEFALLEFSCVIQIRSSAATRLYLASGTLIQMLRTMH